MPTNSEGRKLFIVIILLLFYYFIHLYAWSAEKVLQLEVNKINTSEKYMYEMDISEYCAAVGGFDCMMWEWLNND